MTDPALGDAWDQLHAALPRGWEVGRPMYHDERREWHQFAWDTRVTPRLGTREGQWTAIASSEAGCVAEMARCLREIRAGRWPK